jgi:hypothetical protein
VEKFLDVQHGVPTLLASIVIILALHLFAKVGEFLWGFVKKSGEISDQSIKDLTVEIQINTKAVTKLEGRLNEIERLISEIPKFKTDLRRLFLAVKQISGEDWPNIRRSIMEDENLAP